ncbi:MAG TPA: Gfo/Idh/MocA family oxidoreductase [Tepidisphaeraceae bacterium]|jgi:predicted dehydrogenase|nr:Gfo/Idh/MocA family oxidoreductase [Tepidisphaeraceae bacterium]
MSKHWRCAVIGTGVVGEWHVKVTSQLPNTSLIAVCDIDSARAKKALARYNLPNIPIYTDQAEMLRKEQLDILHICTPSGDHMNPAIMAMEAGKNVITEKPMEIQLDRIDRMHEVAKKNNVRLAGIFQNRWNPANRAIHDALAQGRFGRIAWAGCFTPWYRPDQYYRDGGWRGTWKLDGGGAIMNQSVHAIDLLQWIVGPVKQVSAYASSRIHAEIEVEDTMSCSLEFANGGYGTIMGTTAMFPGQPARIEVGGENGTAVSENGLKVFKFRDERPGDAQILETLCPPAPDKLKEKIAAAGGDALLEKLGLKKSTSTGGGSSNTDVPLDFHARNVMAILNAWDEGHDAETHAAEARKAVAIVLAMYESARKNGAPIQVK